MRRFIFALSAFILCAGVVSAQKYIVVDSEQIFRSVEAYNTALTTLDNLANQYQAKVDAAYAEVETMYNQYICLYLNTN